MKDVHRIVSEQRTEDLELLDSKQPTKHEQFLARALDNKLQIGSSTTDQLSSWANPDPLAISQVASPKHPLKAIISRRGGNAETVRERISDIRWVCARIQGVETKSVSWENALVYPWHLVDAEMAAAFYRFLVAHYSHKPSAFPRISLLR